IFSKVHELIQKGLMLSSGTIGIGGIAASVSKMCFGNRLGFTFEKGYKEKDLFTPEYGSIILELDSTQDLDKIFGDMVYEMVGTTESNEYISINETRIKLEEALTAWKAPLERVFATHTEDNNDEPQNIYYNNAKTVKSSVRVARPKVFIPVFPGTNCEYDTARAFEKAGGEPSFHVFRNITPSDIEASIREMVKLIDGTQIIVLPGGFSSGDEPAGSGKFIATVFRNPRVREAVTKFLQEKDGLILGICNGFQALIKLGLLPYGEIRDMDESSPTLTFNKIGRHVSCMVRTKVVSSLSPWLSKSEVGDIHTIAVSHGEGRFAASSDMMTQLIKNGQVATQYVDFNPNGSVEAVEGITSPDGRIFGKMGHSERTGVNICKNVPGDKEQLIFKAGVEYFS
ncbi:MAG: phosphoribosylformylglycinamidine synthase, partial [Methanosarcina mazei]